MERIRHIAETQQPHTYDRESPHEREELLQAENYDQTGEVHPDQIRVRQYLEEIDEDVLEEIFLEYIRKSGTDEETVNWVPFDQIRVLYKTPEEEVADPSPLGSFNDGNEIELYAHHLDSFRETLYVAIHEELHAISARNSETETTDDFWNTTVIDELQTGIDTTTLKTSRSFANVINDSYREETSIQSSGEKPNEGLTEFISQEVYRQYALRTGEQDPEDSHSEMMKSDYFENQLSVELYIRILSKISQVPLETVKNGVIRTYLRNGEIMPADLRTELQQAGALDKVTSLLQEADIAKIADVVTDLYDAKLIQKQDAADLLAIYHGALEDRADYRRAKTG